MPNPNIMKNWFRVSYIVAALLLVGCQGRHEATVAGYIEGATAEKVYLEEVAESARLIDSVALNDGRYNFVIKNASETPSLYNLVCDTRRIPLFASCGESITLNVADVCEVVGSEESQRLYSFYNDFVVGKAQMESLLQSYVTADNATRKELDEQYNSLYKAVKRKQITFIIENKEHLSAVYALYQRLPGEQYLSSVESDLVYYNTVLEAVQQSHPNGSLVATLGKSVASMKARVEVLNSVEVRSYPELKGKDMYGNTVPLSSLDGNVVLIDFWSAEAGNSNHLNAELKDIYAEYEPRGFKVYQVSADTSKALWITAVQEQKLPWISVCDFGGSKSPMLLTYNVKRLPTNFLVDADGNVVAKNLYGEELERKLSKLLK